MIVFGGILLYNQNELLFKITLIPILDYIVLVILFKIPIERIDIINMQNNSKFRVSLLESI